MALQEGTSHHTRRTTEVALLGAASFLSLKGAPSPSQVDRPLPALCVVSSCGSGSAYVPIWAVRSVLEVNSPVRAVEPLLVDLVVGAVGDHLG
jgi:hypothetical protein